MHTTVHGNWADTTNDDYTVDHDNGDDSTDSEIDDLLVSTPSINDASFGEPAHPYAPTEPDGVPDAPSVSQIPVDSALSRPVSATNSLSTPIQRSPFASLSGVHHEPAPPAAQPSGRVVTQPSANRDDQPASDGPAPGVLPMHPRQPANNSHEGPSIDNAPLSTVLGGNACETSRAPEDTIGTGPSAARPTRSEHGSRPPFLIGKPYL